MYKNPLISIIVPIYGVEQYLEKCINSIINQTYRDLEIILIDDGSPDRCGEICDRYAAMDSRIKVIHQQHKGASEARNAGIMTATGEYIGFIDADDWCEPRLFEVLLDAINQTDADAARCNFRYIYTEQVENRINAPLDRNILTGREAILNSIYNPYWMKLQRAELEGKDK